MKKKDNPQIAEIVGETPLANPQGKTVKELEELVQTLQTQLRHHQTMTVKAQGALEVIQQLIPKREGEEMIAAETQVNGEMVNDAETAD